MPPKTPKKAKLIWYPKSFVGIIDRDSKILEPFMRKTHWTMGNELQFRYEQFTEMQQLLRNIITNFIPSELQQQYLDLIPQSQVDFLLLHPSLEYEILLSHLQQALFF